MSDEGVPSAAELRAGGRLGALPPHGLPASAAGAEAHLRTPLTEPPPGREEVKGKLLEHHCEPPRCFEVRDLRGHLVPRRGRCLRGGPAISRSARAPPQCRGRCGRRARGGAGRAARGRPRRHHHHHLQHLQHHLRHRRGALRERGRGRERGWGRGRGGAGGGPRGFAARRQPRERRGGLRRRRLLSQPLGVPVPAAAVALR